MIPRDFITEWRREAPWVLDAQVEQDLIISRALTEIFSHPILRRSLAFRGGTALYKLHLKPPARYSEDIDLVQITAEPAGDVMDALRSVLNPWLGEPRWKQTEGRVTFTYRFQSEDNPPLPLKLKVEINTREHFSLYGVTETPFSVSSRWHKADCLIASYALDELLGTKLRALYQRKKGRDLLDLDIALTSSSADPNRIVAAFQEYMERSDQRVSRAEFEENLMRKLGDSEFTADISPLLAPGRSFDIQRAADVVFNRLITRLPGAPWKGSI